MRKTHFAPATNLLWLYLEHCGHEPAKLFLKAGIDPALLRQHNARIHIDQVDDLWRMAAETLDDPEFGLKMADAWHPSYLGALGYAWCASSSLRTALKRTVRYSHVVSEDLNIQLTDTSGGLRVILDLEDAFFTLPQHHDVGLTVLLYMCRFNFGPELEPTEAEFAHEAPRDPGLYESVYRCPLRFDTKNYTMTFALKDVDRALLSGNARIASLHDEELMRYLVEIRKGDFVEQLKSVILDQLPSGNLTESAVAREMHLSDRSLQRKLQQQGTTFRAVLEQVRRQAANQYIRNPDMSMSDIAFLLGFSEQSAFTRAFKNWMGDPPLRYRRQLINDRMRDTGHTSR